MSGVEGSSEGWPTHCQSATSLKNYPGAVGPLTLRHSKGRAGGEVLTLPIRHIPPRPPHPLPFPSSFPTPIGNPSQGGVAHPKRSRRVERGAAHTLPIRLIPPRPPHPTPYPPPRHSRPRSGIHPKAGSLILSGVEGSSGGWPTHCQSVTFAPTTTQPLYSVIPRLPEESGAGSPATTNMNTTQYLDPYPESRNRKTPKPRRDE